MAKRSGMAWPGRDMSWKEFSRDLLKETSRDNVLEAAAALTFYAVLAIFPFLIFLVALASVIIDPLQATELVEQLEEVAPQEVTALIGGRLEDLGAQQNVGLLTIGALVAVWSASVGLQGLASALNRVYGVEETRPYWKVRGLAIVMTIVAAAIILAATAAMVALPPIAAAIGGPVEDLVRWLRFPVAGLMMMFVWALLYYSLPDVEQRFRFITPGSVIGVVVWLVASWGFSVYVRNFGDYEATYGALGGFVVLLLWMWISSTVVLLGAEVNAVIEHKSPAGKKVGAHQMKDSGLGHVDEGEHEEHRRPAPSRPRREEPRPGRTRGLLNTAALAFAFLVYRRARS